MAGRWWGRLTALGPAVLLAAACTTAAAPFPPPPQSVSVTMREYGYDYKPPAAAGRIVFNARNAGKVDHEMVVVTLGDGIPPIAEQLQSGNRLVVPTVARLSSRKPGSSGTFALDLTPGRYALICFVKDPDGGQHAQKGMSTEFRL